MKTREDIESIAAKQGLTVEQYEQKLVDYVYNAMVELEGALKDAHNELEEIK